MNWTPFSRFATLLGLAFTAPLAVTQPSFANQFTETAIAQTEVIAVARPYGTETTKYDLLVLEQIPNKKQCWQTSGTDPIMVDPLLLNFDFTGHCRRATDSNGYSVRIDGQDYGLEYLLRLVPDGNEIKLVATSRTGKAPELYLGSTKGLASGFMAIQLNPGWQFTKRTYQGKALGHYYISGSQATIVQPSATTTPPTPTPPSMTPPAVTPPSPGPAPVTPDPVQPDLPPQTTTPDSNQGMTVIESNNGATTVEEVTIVETQPIAPRPQPPQGNRRPRPTPDDFRRF